MSLVIAWENAQQEIKEKVGITSYDTWFAGLSTKEAADRQLVIEAPDEFFRDWLVDHYQTIIQDAVQVHTQFPIEIQFEINSTVAGKTLHTETKRLNQGFDNTPERLLQINNRFTFDNFVIGPSNRFACAATQAVAESPAKAYNPLFIYGQVGLGKTHLMQAVAHKIKELHPNLKCLYLSSEQFTNELINAIRHRSTTAFRDRYRNIDVLLIDDIHFIAGKESTQEEFFHTFNALHDSHKQIIISSDRPPREISNLEERLSSRFAWGLITDIQPPDFETRVAILKKKNESENINVPDDVINYIAEQIKTNIRELEGALIRVVAYSLLDDSPVSLVTAKQVLKDMVKESIKTISIEMVQSIVAEFYQLTVADLKTSRRSKNIVLPRQIAMFLSRKLTNHSLPEIGKAFGGKDHTTVMHSCKKIDGLIHSSSGIKGDLEKIEMILQQ